MRIVVDASAVAKWYLPERDHAPARRLRDDYVNGTHDLAAPALLPFEVANALRYSGHYAGERFEAAVRSLPEYGIELVPFGKIERVAEIAESLDATVYDASYVALAAAFDTVAYTADETLLDAVGESDYGEHVEHVSSY